MIKNASSNLTGIISSNTADTNRKLDAITKWIQDCPYTWGEDSPENTVYANVGTIYTDKKNGKIYKKLYNDGENNGWVELKTNIEKDFITLKFKNQQLSSLGQLFTFEKINGNMDFLKYSTGSISEAWISVTPNKKYLISTSPATFSQAGVSGSYLFYSITDFNGTKLSNESLLISPGYPNYYQNSGGIFCVVSTPSVAIGLQVSLALSPSRDTDGNRGSLSIIEL